jgi:hypothetical protein
MSVPLSRLIADLIGASAGIWGIWNLLQKQHRLCGAARALRWIVIVGGVGVFEGSERGWFDLHWSIFSLGVFGLLAACFFFAFPDIPFYLVTALQKATGWPRGPQSMGDHGVKPV